MQGGLVDSGSHQETMADYLSSVQWAARDTTPMQATTLGPVLPVEVGPVQEREVVEAAKATKWDKACGSDAIPADFWKAICCRDSPARAWAVALCQKCWEDGEIPDSWHESLVITIFKKGDASLCENYRPICLLQAGYKLFAALLLRRLKRAGAEDRIWRTQFGFKSKHGTTDAIFIARRKLEEAFARENKPLVLLALDWAKAFDSVMPDALIEALRRFRLPSKMLDIVPAFCSSRS